MAASAPLRLAEKHDGALDPEIDVRLWLRLLSTAMIIEKRVRRRFADQFDTTLPRFDILAALDRAEGGMTMGDLSRMLLVSNGNITALVQLLMKEGLVDVAPDTKDRRISRVTLLPRGAEQFASLAAAHRRWIRAMFAALSPQTKAALFDMLGEVKSSLGKENDR